MSKSVNSNRAKQTRFGHGLRSLQIGVALAALTLASCGGGGGGTPAPTVPVAPTVAVSGTVSTPGGALAFNAPTGIRRFFAEIFGRSAIAALSGTTGVAGVTVKLIQIGNDGNQLGADLATAVTGGGGSFVINAPAGFIPGPSFVIRAVGATETLDRLVTDLATQDVDPASDVTKTQVIAGVVSTGGIIQNVLPLQVEEVSNQVASMVADVDAASTGTTVALRAALVSEAQNDEELGFATANLAAVGGLSGTVTDSVGAPLANIKIVARDFNLWVARAETRTNAAGQYTLKVAAGDYIIGALNFTGTSTAASEWWTCNDVPSGPVCGAGNQFSAVRVIVVGASLTAVNFKLEPGARVTGSMTGGGLPLPGVQLAVRDFASDQPVAFTRAQADGSFRVNVRPGTYSIGARNRTAQPYASGMYNNAPGGGTTTGGGGANATEATPMVLVAGNTYAVNFALVEGGVVRGRVTDGVTAPPNNAVSGISVRFDDASGAFVQAERTNLTGGYRMWLRPGTYTVRARGQTATPAVVATSTTPNPAAVNFGAVVAKGTATIFAPGGITPRSGVKVRLYETLSGNQDLVGHESSNGDGTVEVYVSVTGSYLIEYKVDDGSTTVGTAIHDGTPTPNGTKTLGQTVPNGGGTPLTFTTGSTTALGNITLPAGGELTGKVTTNGVTPVGNIVVRLQRGTGGGTRVTSTRTQSDGSYTLSAVAGPNANNAYPRVCAFVNGNGCANVANPAVPGLTVAVDNVTLNPGTTNTQNFVIGVVP